MDTSAYHAMAAAAAGAAAAGGGDVERACAAYDEAAELFGRAGAPYQRAYARLELARLLVRADRRHRARDEAEAALAAFRELGAARAAAAAAAEFLGELDRRPRRPAGLTARELEVLGLLAQGLTNREIAERLVVSDHTVHRHVANILRKLGLPTRAAAAAWAARQRMV
jgi:LuxR family transcriptional regulator, maltose regulon positive regulatory protein